MKTFNQTKTEIETKQSEVEKPKFKEGSLNDLQNMLKDIYNKLNDFNERINLLEK